MGESRFIPSFAPSTQVGSALVDGPYTAPSLAGSGPTGVVTRGLEDDFPRIDGVLPGFKGVMGVGVSPSFFSLSSRSCRREGRCVCGRGRVSGVLWSSSGP